MASNNGPIDGMSAGGVATDMNGTAAAAPANNVDGGALAVEPSSLDHALLESLFMDEMVMMDSSHHGYTNFLEAVPVPVPAPQSGPMEITPTRLEDSKDVAEKALLRDFGVSESPMAPSKVYRPGVAAVAAVPAPVVTVASATPVCPPPAPSSSSSQQPLPQVQAYAPSQPHPHLQQQMQPTPHGVQNTSTHVNTQWTPAQQYVPPQQQHLPQHLPQQVPQQVQVLPTSAQQTAPGTAVPTIATATTTAAAPVAVANHPPTAPLGHASIMPRSAHHIPIQPRPPLAHIAPAPSMHATAPPLDQPHQPHLSPSATAAAAPTMVSLASSIPPSAPQLMTTTSHAQAPAPAQTLQPQVPGMQQPHYTQHPQHSHSSIPIQQHQAQLQSQSHIHHPQQQHFHPLHQAVGINQAPIAQQPQTAPVPAPAPAPSNGKAEQLVQQFATLASRLGIELTKDTLRNLTATANLDGDVPVTTTSSSSSTQSPVPQATANQAPNASTNASVVPLSAFHTVNAAGSTTTTSSPPTQTQTNPPQTQLQPTFAATAMPTSATAAVTSALISPQISSAPSIQTLPQIRMQSSNIASQQMDMDIDTSASGSAPADVSAAHNTMPPTPKLIPVVEEVRKTAEAAIEAVSSRKRDLPPSFDNDAKVHSGAAGSSKMVYSKRRKKPTLSDCESKLAELQAENELLKRHLDHISNKVVKFDKEKSAASQRIKAYLENGATISEMQRGVQDFSEMYSDYGRRRQRELNFHLEQLQRLVNPTNFTKMGLWTLAQGNPNPKHNPIAGILQQELEITPQQGKKILFQREKIRSVCENLKECLQLLANLRGLCAQKTRLFHDRMKKCQEILTPEQVVKLIRWVDENSQVLSSVCPGWGAEQFPLPTK